MQNAQMTPTWKSHIQNPRRQHALKVRDKTEAGIRTFFRERGFIETRTPLLVASPGMEPHIRPIEIKTNTSRVFLPTSPEFAMKKLLAGGLTQIFQICPAFRDEPLSTTHHPEFTMLEWYRAHATEHDIKKDTEITFQGKKISVKTPWPRLRTRDLFKEITEIDLVKSATPQALAKDCARLGIQTSAADTWDDLYFKIWLNCIEPKLPHDQAVFVTRYPASQAALAVVDKDPDGSLWARRFEAYAGGLELANAFYELTDPIEQRKRFEKDMELRAQTYGPEFLPNPIDEEFMRALKEGLPPSAGIALGVDRLVMLLADEPEIAYTIWLESPAVRLS
jgi:lysyl-tRNA synthetase class 2